MSDNALAKRRHFLTACSIAGLSVLAWPFTQWATRRAQTTPSITAQGTQAAHAHLLRDSPFSPIQQTAKTQVAIIGSGVAGLSAAYQLQQHGISDLQILELESMIGGNSASGSNTVSAFPWGAHYLPVPSIESAFLYSFLREINVITGFNEQGLPYYNELYLCHDLKERLYLNGSWQEGLVPQQGLTVEDKTDIERFFALMAEYKQAKGHDGRYAFTIPVDASSQDMRFRHFDTITMHTFLDRHGFHSAALHWYINYCCRDDFGAGLHTVSAWAALHYFAARRPHLANGDEESILVWPEGNGFLVQGLAKSLQNNIQTECLVYDIRQAEDQFAICYFDAKQQCSVQLLADHVIIATPRFVAKHFCHPGLGIDFSKIDTLQYAPWLVANITLSAAPARQGADLAWDNVSYYSTSLGYIHAQHQSLQAQRGQMVITYYLPLDEVPAKQARQIALHRQAQEWQQIISNDLENMHPGIASNIEEIQYRILGHGMICPTPGVVSQQRLALPRVQNRLYFAHSDMSGLSLFEEAFWQGLQTANALLNTRLACAEDTSPPRAI